jgi:hypothetical protein
VRAEDPAVGVALVDDDHPQGAEKGRPPLVPGQQGEVDEVGVGEDVAGVLADPPSLVRRGVPVIGGHPQPRQGQRVDPGPLVLRQGLGRREVEGGRAPPGRRRGAVEHRREQGQEVAQALARRCPGRQDDILASADRLGGLDLVAPGSADPRPDQRGDQRGGCPGRPLTMTSVTPREVLDVAQRAVRTGGSQRLEQVGVGERACDRVVCRRFRARLGTSHGPPTVRAWALLPFEPTPFRR